MTEQGFLTKELASKHDQEKLRFLERGYHPNQVASQQASKSLIRRRTRTVNRAYLIDPLETRSIVADATTLLHN